MPRRIRSFPGMGHDFDPFRSAPKVRSAPRKVHVPIKVVRAKVTKKPLPYRDGNVEKIIAKKILTLFRKNSSASLVDVVVLFGAKGQKESIYPKRLVVKTFRELVANRNLLYAPFGFRPKKA